MKIIIHDSLLNYEYSNYIKDMAELYAHRLFGKKYDDYEVSIYDAAYFRKNQSALLGGTSFRSTEKTAVISMSTENIIINKKDVLAFVLAHEFGHIKQFFTNTLSTDPSGIVYYRGQPTPFAPRYSDPEVHRTLPWELEADGVAYFLTRTCAEEIDKIWKT